MSKSSLIPISNPKPFIKKVNPYFEPALSIKQDYRVEHHHWESNIFGYIEKEVYEKLLKHANFSIK